MCGGKTVDRLLLITVSTQKANATEDGDRLEKVTVGHTRYQVLHFIPVALLRLSEPSLDGIDFNGPDIGKDVGVGGWGISL